MKNWPSFMQLQVAAARCALGKDGRQFSDDDVVGLRWFAFMPNALKGKDFSEYVFDETNLMGGRFWAAYMKAPDAALRAATKIRRVFNWKEGTQIPSYAFALSVLQKLDPGVTTNKEAAYLAIELAGLKPSSSSATAMERMIRRILAHARRTKTGPNLSG